MKYSIFFLLISCSGAEPFLIAHDNEIDSGTDLDTDTGEFDTGEFDTGEFDTDTDTGEFDTGEFDTDTDTDMDNFCPWECRPNIGQYSCGYYDADNVPTHVHNWDYDFCTSGQICCQPITSIDSGAYTEYCNETDQSACSSKIDDDCPRYPGYCHHALNVCCAK